MGVSRNIKIGQWCLKHRLNVFAKILRFQQKLMYNCDIPYLATIAADVHFDHQGFGCVINPRTTIEGPCEIQHGVTIGELQPSGPVPIIKKNSHVGANATLLGGLVVGEGAKIGAGALVLTDVPDGKTAVGVPAKIL